MVGKRWSASPLALPQRLEQCFTIMKKLYSPNDLQTTVSTKYGLLTKVALPQKDNTTWKEV